MANTSYLQLYLDTDYLLPVAVGVDGNLVKYQDQQGDSRLWLYFSKVGGRAVYQTGSAEKANYEARIEGFFGDFWNHLEKGDNVGNEPFAYIELLEVAGLLDTLRNWCKPVLGTATPTVVLNFATTICIKSRRLFIDYLVKKGFNIRSYSIEINDLVAEKVSYDHRSTMHLTFGDQIMILQSTGDKILLSTMTWCGDRFMQGESPMQLQKHGDDFKKTALAKMVVEKMEQYNNLLNSSEIANEIAFQTQFANEWFKNRDGNSIRIKGFYYSSDPSQLFPSIQIDANQLDLLVEANSRETTNLIARYYRENIINNHLHTIFFGDVFRDELFLKNSIDVTSSQNKFTFFNDNALQEALGRYYYGYGEFKEPVEELERRFLTLGQERERIRKYVKNAERLGSIRAAIDKSEKDVCLAIASVKSNISLKEASWKDQMQISNFDAAEKVLDTMSSNEVLTTALGALFDTLCNIEANTSLLTDLKQMNDEHVRAIVNDIECGFEELQKLQAEAKDLDTRPNFLRQRTLHYREAYSTYKEYKRQLDQEQSLAGKRRVLNEMRNQDLTMEALPEVDVKTVTAVLKCEVKIAGGSWFRKKKHTLMISLQVEDGDVLPFPCVVMIATSQKATLDRSDWCADLEAGSSQWQKSISTDELPESEKYVVQLFPNEKYDFNRNSIYCEARHIKL